MTTGPSASEQTEQPAVSGLKAAELALADPLKEETRKARLYLLGVSMVGIAIVWTGLVPQEITTLGIKFGEANRQALLLILALVVAYFLVAFTVYGTSDYIASRYTYVNAVWSESRAELSKLYEEDRRVNEQARWIVEQAEATLKAAKDRHEEVSNTEARARRRLSRSKENLDSLLGQSSYSGREEERLRQNVADEQIQVEENKLAVEQQEDRIREATEDLKRANLEAEELRKQWHYKIARSQSPDIRGHSVTLDSVLNRYQEPQVTEAAKFIERYSALAPGVSLARRIFEFVPPLVVGVYAIWALLLS